MNLTATQISLLRTLLDGGVRQVSTTMTRRCRTSRAGARQSTLLALRDRGLITLCSRRERETERGVSIYFSITDAQITDAGRAALAMLAQAA